IGGDPVKSIGDLIDQFHISPEQKAQMQQAAQQLELQRDQLVAGRDQALAEINEKNIESARSMQVSVRSSIPPLLGLLVTLGFFGLLYWMAMREIPAANKDVLNIMLGSLGTAWVAVIGYYFGSSSGSDRKTELLAGAPPAKTKGNA
ncbi:MAG: hypothetical protein ACREP9_14430, partial [Candidatus Dormibacteraceae bacterium]